MSIQYVPLFLFFVAAQDLTAQEVEAEMKTQREVAFELSELTSVLKQATLQIHESVSQQNKVCSLSTR